MLLQLIMISFPKTYVKWNHLLSLKPWKVLIEFRGYTLGNATHLML